MTQPPLIRHEWVCGLKEVQPSAACSARNPHGPDYDCGYWYIIKAPVCGIVTDFVSILRRLTRMGALRDEAPSKDAPGS